MLYQSFHPTLHQREGVYFQKVIVPLPVVFDADHLVLNPDYLKNMRMPSANTKATSDKE